MLDNIDQLWEFITPSQVVFSNLPSPSNPPLKTLMKLKVLSLQILVLCGFELVSL